MKGPEHVENLNISIGLSPKLIHALSELAEAKNMTFASLVRSVLEHYLKQEGEHPAPETGQAEATGQEKRKYERKAVTIPTSINFHHGKDCIPQDHIEMVNVSLGGALLSLPLDHNKLQSLINDPGSFELELKLPNEENPIQFVSKTSRVKKTKDRVQLGISFDEYSYYDFIKLYNFLG